jgi:serine/threonine-protein kinase RsbW
MAPVRKVFTADVNELEAVRSFLTSVGESIGMDKNKIYKLCLAADEIATNIIIHGYIEAGIEGGSFEISLQVENDMLITTISDAAVQFNPLQRNMPTPDDLALPLEERAIGGLGILMAKESVDEYCYAYEDGKNLNILKIKLGG